MSQENVDRFRTELDAFNRRDLQAFLTFMHPEVEYTPLVIVMEGRYEGHDGIRRRWDDLFAVFPDWRAEGHSWAASPSTTVAALKAGGHGGESGTPVGQILWQVAEWTDDGRMRRVTNYPTETEALEAVGLAE